MKRDTRQALIEAGAELVHRQGFARTGLQEILAAAGVPKGSFYFYFASKEEFGLALIEHHRRTIGQRLAKLLNDPSLPPLARLAAFFARVREQQAADGCALGCPIGNLAQELSDLSPAMREELKKSLAGLDAGLCGVLGEAAERGELPDGMDPAQAASFIIDALEGALLRMKAEKSVEPLLRFEEFIFTRVLG